MCIQMEDARILVATQKSLNIVPQRSFICCVCVCVCAGSFLLVAFCLVACARRFSLILSFVRCYCYHSFIQASEQVAPLCNIIHENEHILKNCFAYQMWMSKKWYRKTHKKRRMHSAPNKNVCWICPIRALLLPLLPTLASNSSRKREENMVFRISCIEYASERTIYSNKELFFRSSHIFFCFFPQWFSPFHFWSVNPQMWIIWKKMNKEFTLLLDPSPSLNRYCIHFFLFI